MPRFYFISLSHQSIHRQTSDHTIFIERQQTATASVARLFILLAFVPLIFLISGYQHYIVLPYQHIQSHIYYNRKINSYPYVIDVYCYVWKKCFFLTFSFHILYLEFKTFYSKKYKRYRHCYFSNNLILFINHKKYYEETGTPK